MSELILDVQHVSHQYESRPVLEDITFGLKRGEMLGLVGPNGSGKSTLLKLILGVLPLTNGMIHWFGQPLQKFDAWPRIGYVSQKANSFNSGFPATVSEVVMMGLTGKLGLFRRPGRAERERVQLAIETVGMGEFADRNIGRLSGGQQQRVFIARALVSEPDVLILDEPTVGVDAQSEEKFYELLQRLNRERGISMILVSHDLGAVSTKMHSIACLNHKLFYHGGAKEFEENRTEILLRSYGHDVHVLHHDHHHGH
ncbi:zinc transport system ATP-binding protein [Aneurinibacillus soli]|uniref:High-affinity zinc uptake system ATP-binding protein ZnuC n=1 Tax=Aneurinibacillus soli TaxID=1500254 RepID=A0A0U4WAP1_9BACL|nr:metal ABC transporter ATP-binding protein [Aneurinibacillus soli]PYE57167.1 zinc transport system ATP-binding protein [Aneurinibacillus soli]BAU25977.1 High-affinity zinc uptake system ATP-binding protein ZnuC [Aneurinibacillus soli]